MSLLELINMNRIDDARALLETTCDKKEHPGINDLDASGLTCLQKVYAFLDSHAHQPKMVESKVLCLAVELLEAGASFPHDQRENFVAVARKYGCEMLETQIKASLYTRKELNRELADIMKVLQMITKAITLKN